MQSHPLVTEPVKTQKRNQIVDVTDKTVRVRYVNTGSRDLETKAMQLIAKHCGQGGFRVTNRTVQATYRNLSGEPTQIAIDAVCL